MTDINKVIFSRTAPLKKKAIVNALTEPELLRVSADTVMRIVKEVGSGKYRSRNKGLCFYDDKGEKVGNSWNSTISFVYIEKGKLWFCVYVQYENTDTDTIEPFAKVMQRDGFRGQMRRDDMHGNPRTYYFSYDEEDQAKIIRAILLTYINLKYKDKL